MSKSKPFTCIEYGLTNNNSSAYFSTSFFFAVCHIFAIFDDLSKVPNLAKTEEKPYPEL